jgi:hypothetical protein
LTDLPTTAIARETLDAVQQELARVSREGAHNQIFWDAIFDQIGRMPYLTGQQQRRQEINEAIRAAHLAQQSAQTVLEKRAARKLARKAKVGRGQYRHLQRNPSLDPLTHARRLNTKWVGEARDLSIALARWHTTYNQLRQGPAPAEDTLPSPAP